MTSDASDRSDDSASRAGAQRLWTPRFLMLLAAQACFGYAFSSFFLLPTFLTRELGASATQVGAVMGAPAAAVILLLPLAGRLIDRLGRQRFLVLGGALMSVACALFVFVTAVGPLLFALRILQALAFSLAFASGGALAIDLAPRARVGQALGLFGLTFLAMNGVAGLCVELLAQQAGWPAAFGLSAVAAAASAVLALAVYDAFVPPARGGDRDVQRRPEPRRIELRSLSIMACVGLALGAMFNFAQLHAAQLGDVDVSDFFLAYAITGVVLRGGFGHLLDAWGPRRVALGALAVYVLVVAATVRLDVFGLLWIGAVLGVAHGIFYPAYTAVVLATADEDARGRVVADVQAAFSVGGVACVGLGAVADRFGYAAVFEIAAFGLLVALCLLVTHARAQQLPEAAAPVGGPTNAVLPEAAEP